MRSRAMLAGVVVAVLVGALIAYVLLGGETESGDFSAERFERVERGLTSAEVEELIGEPDAIQGDPLPSDGSDFENWIYIHDGNFYEVGFSGESVALVNSRPCVDDGSCEREQDALPQIDDR